MPARQFTVERKTFPDMESARDYAKKFEPAIVAITENYNGKSAGDYLRHAARREFGQRIARRWFN